MKAQNNLLNKYYKGETSLKEEKELKSEILQEENNSAEQDIFGYFDSQNNAPIDLEDSLFVSVMNKNQKQKTVKMRLYSISSAAAVIIIFLSIYLDFRNTQNIKLENDFFVMEKALYQISESIQPEEMEDMLVLWVDDDVEIIIN